MKIRTSANARFEFSGAGCPGVVHIPNPWQAEVEIVLFTYHVALLEDCYQTI